MRNAFDDDLRRCWQKYPRITEVRTVRVAAAQTFEYRENIDAALKCMADAAARAEPEGALLLCLPEGFLQGI